MAGDTAPLRLSIDRDALIGNWRWLAARSGPAACGAAVKADGYGLGAQRVVDALTAAGARDFYVATWDEAAAVRWPVQARVSVLHGARDADMAAATRMDTARPVLSTVAQIARWRPTGRVCDVMVDTGMNRLGVAPDAVAAGCCDGLVIDTLMSHLACADEDHPMNAEQAAALRALAGRTSARRLSLANSAGICLGADYAFDLTRPGLALYGGIPRAEASGAIRPVVAMSAEVLQVRTVTAGATVGYNATWRATRDTRVAIVNLGYADGYPVALSGRGSAMDGAAPLLGRVSMDLTAFAVPGDVDEGDWLPIDFDIASVAKASGRSQYELLTALGHRFPR